MKQSIMAVCLIALSCALPAKSAAVTYVITLFGDVPAGSFTYNPSLPDTGVGLFDAFTSFTVMFGDTAFNMLDSGTLTIGSPSACLDGQTGDAAVFEMLTNCPYTSWIGNLSTDLPQSFIMLGGDSATSLLELDYVASIYGDTNLIGSGAFQVALEMPEPSASALMLFGLSWLIKKHICSRVLGGCHPA
jgi:hypothetical protein